MMTPNVAAADTSEAARAYWMRQRELEVVQEIAHAFLTASSALEVYRLALARVTPLLSASFGSIFLRDPSDATLLKMECAHNWPQSSARYMGQLRVRVGRGPTGRAVAEGRTIEVEDVRGDPRLREWWEPARELGFTSLAALPLMAGGEPVGALSLYFTEQHRFDDEERRLLALTADQLSATWARAHLIE
ncbi:MAG: GAF domain-containing protein, partial [Longimicrobiales bacterium]